MGAQIRDSHGLTPSSPSELEAPGATTPRTYVGSACRPGCVTALAPLPSLPTAPGLLPLQVASPGQVCGMLGGVEAVHVSHPCSFPRTSIAFQNVFFKTKSLFITLLKGGGLLSRWAWVESRPSHFITCVTLATSSPLRTLSPYLFNGSENPTWQGCCGVQSR